MVQPLSFAYKSLLLLTDIRKDLAAHRELLSQEHRLVHGGENLYFRLFVLISDPFTNRVPPHTAPGFISSPTPQYITLV
jgi:hypothetical protein